MSDIVFVDTNILVYAHDADAGDKRDRAIAALTALWDSGRGRLSVQVLQEFFVTVTRKLTTPLSRSVAREVVSTYGSWIGTPTTAQTVLRAIDLAAMAKLSFWDALIVAAAEDASASDIYSEDLNPGQSIVGIRVTNPVVAAP